MPDSLETGPSRLAHNRTLLVVVLVVINSLHFVFARLLLPHISPEVSVMYVLGIGTVEVGLFGLMQRNLHLGVFRKNLGFFLVIGFLVAASSNINYEAIVFIDPGTAALLSRMATLFGIGFGLLWLREKLSRAQWGGVLVAVAGVFIITFQPGDYLRFGSLLILISSFMYALHTAVVKRYGEEMGFLDFFFFRLLCTTGFLFLFSLGRRALVWPSTTAWLLIILIGTVDVAISRTLYYLALRWLTMSVHSIVLTLSPVTAVIWSLLFFDVVPAWQQLVGGAAVILGVLAVTIRPSQR